MIAEFENCQFNIWKADTFWLRFKGLMGTKSLPENSGLLLVGCSSIHCCFMNYTIDVVYLDDAYKVLAKETVKPWRIGKIVPGATHVLELHEGCAKLIKVGEIMRITEV